MMSQTNYKTMNLKDLKAVLKKMNVKGVSKLNKKQILALLSQREKVEAEKKQKTQLKQKRVKKVIELTDLPIEKKQLPELKELCRQNNVKGFSSMKKTQIVTLLKYIQEQKVEFIHPVHELFSEQDDVAEPTYVLEKMSLKDLKKTAKFYKLKKYSKLKRVELMSLIQSRTLFTSVEKIQMKLKKMNVTALKKICRELKLKGYSKLNKLGVVELVMTKNVMPVEEEEKVVNAEQ